jgi:hypothetical protein
MLRATILVAGALFVTVLIGLSARGPSSASG